VNTDFPTINLLLKSNPRLFDFLLKHFHQEKVVESRLDFFFINKRAGSNCVKFRIPFFFSEASLVMRMQSHIIIDIDPGKSAVCPLCLE